MVAKTTVRTIRITVDNKTRGQLKNVERNLRGMEKSLKRTAKSANTLKNAFLGLATLSFAKHAIRSLVQVSDTMQLMTDRMKLFSEEGESAVDVMSKLTRVASSQGQNVEDLATVYTRLGVALKNTGISTGALLGLTRALAQSFRLAGASGAEVAATSIQLSQAFASGELRGQELRSVVEQNATLAQALQEKFKLAGDGIDKVAESIFKFSEKRGGITAAETIGAIVDQLDNWEKGASKLNFTIAQTINIITNQGKDAWNRLNDDMQITATISAALLAVFTNLTRTFVVFAGLIGAAVIIKYAGGIAGLAAAFGNLAVQAIYASISTAALSGSFKVAATSALATAAATATLVFEFALLTAGVTLAVYAIIDLKGAMSDLTIVSTFFADTFGKFLVLFAQGLKLLPNGEKAFGKLSIKLNEVGREILKVSNATRAGKLNKGDGLFAKIRKDLEDFKKTLEGKAINIGLAKLNEQFSKTGDIDAYTAALKKLRLKELDASFKKGDFDAFVLEKKKKEIEQLGIVIPKTASSLAKLNNEYAKNKDVAAYFNAIDTAKLKDLDTKFKKGSLDLSKIKAAEFASQMKDLQRELSAGAMSFEEFNSSADALKLNDINFQLEAGVISLKQYNEQLILLNDKVRPGSAFAVGAQRYIEKIGSVSSQIAAGIESTFSRLEDSMFDFIKKGTFEFSKFTQAILDDITRIIIRMSIVRPLAGAAVSAFSGGGTAAASSRAGAINTSTSTLQGPGFAQGGAFGANGVQFFAQGGIVNSATAFGFGGGSLGVMGEKGPEAILPLKRGTDGALGVQAAPANVIVNVVNNANDSEVQASETTNENGERVIELLVVNTVKSGIANGSFDKQFSANFNLNRKR